MHYFDFGSERPGLLVSVRNADEARIALAGGADVIDVKEPDRGSLGAADADVVASVVAVVGERVPISVAAGELLDGESALLRPTGIAFMKVGLAGCEAHAGWAARYRAVIQTWQENIRPVAVVYADWRFAAAPPPEDVLALAAASGCSALLVDTWNKSRGDLFDHWPSQDVARFCDRVREAGIAIVLAGSLQGVSLKTAAACHPHLVAVRGAVCDGGRVGTISAARLRTVWAALRTERAVAGDSLWSPPARELHHG